MAVENRPHSIVIKGYPEPYSGYNQLSSIEKVAVVKFALMQSHDGLDDVFELAMEMLQAGKLEVSREKETKKDVSCFLDGLDVLFGAMQQALIQKSGTKTQDTDAKHCRHTDVHVVTGMPDPDEDPNSDKPKEHEVKFPENEAQVKHIFRNDPDGGHVLDRLANRKLLLDTVDKKNFFAKDIYGKSIYSRILSDGRQVWVEVKNSIISNGGINIKALDLLKKYVGKL